MDQEKFATLNQPSNANMPRDTVETLKQIQKQGLSISIVKSNSGSYMLPSTTSIDSRPKQSVLTVDKPKIAPRPPAATENKAQILQARLTSADTRVSSGRVTTQSSTFHDSKAPANQTRPNQPPVSENKGFNQVWSGPNSSTENKSQGTTSRPLPTTPSNKIQTSQARINQIHISDNKTPVSRSNQSMITENKSQGRVTQGQRVTQNQQLIESKILSNDRVNVNPASPPDAKVFSNQARTGQQFVVSQDNKASPVQRVIAQKVTDKIVNQLNPSKQVDAKTTSLVNRVVQNVKVLPEANQSKIRPNYAVKSDGKLSIGVNSPMIVENKTVRLVTNVLDGGATRTTQCKSSSTQMRLHPNVSGTETPTAVQTKMIVTKMICYQSVPVPPENKVILQGAKVTASSSDMIQKTAAVFDVSTDASHGNPLSARIATSKRSTTVFGSPAKKKCIKRIAPNSAEMGSKSQDGSNLTSPEDGNENEDQFFNNLKTSRTGLTITPVRPSATSTPTSIPNPLGVVRMPGELSEKDVYRLAWENSAMVSAQRGKPRSRSKRKYVEPVCLTLSSDDEEEHMQAPFNSIEEALANQAQMFPQESEGSKSGQSSPVYQDEDNNESDDPQFPGVTDIHPKSVEERLHYEDEEEEEEEKDMEDMEMEEEESLGNVTPPF